MPHTSSDLPIIEQLSAIIKERDDAPNPDSYTSRLLGDELMACRKIMEEAYEVTLEITNHNANPHLVAGEAADLIYHLLVALRTQGVSWHDVEVVLAQRLHQPARHSTYDEA